MSLALSSQLAPLPCDASPPYWRETLRPYSNLVFLLPLILLYELGVTLTNGFQDDAVRNGADAWMRIWMQRAGIEFLWLPPFLLIATLLVWHAVSKQPWTTNWNTQSGMLSESLLYAFVLIMLGQLTDYSFRHATWLQLESDPEPSLQTDLFVRVVTFMGAGIYEEFLFRLCLLPAAYLAFRALLVPKSWAIAGTVVISSLVFSLAHYLGPAGDDQSLALLTEAVARVQSSRELWFSFVFRTLAGMFFAALFFFRGFGIAVGTHAIYDVFVGVILIQEL